MVSCLNLAVGLFFNLIGLIFPDFPYGEFGKIHFFNEATFQAETSYALLGGGLFDGSSEIILQLSEIYSNEFIYRLFSCVDSSLVLFIVFFLFKNSYKLFDNLTENFKSGTSFCEKSYRNIRHIGFWILSFWLLGVLNGILFSVFLLKDVVVQGTQLELYPDISALGGLLPVLVILAFAEVYRAGVVMQEESELTI